MTLIALPLVSGALGTWIGLRQTLWIATAGALAGVLWLLPSPVLRLRDLPENGGDAPLRASPADRVGR